MKIAYLLVGVLVLLGSLQKVDAQPYPNRPIRLVVPFPPGGAADLAARTVTQALSQALGQTMVIDNRGGADGAIAGDVVKTSAADGYTLLFATTTGLNAAPVMRKEPPYDPITAFTPISMVGKFGFFLFVHESLPAKTVAEFLAYVRANPGKVNYGTDNGTSILFTAQLASIEKLDMQHIPYKGDAPASADLIAGRVQVMIGTPGSAMPQVKEGRLRVLATLLPNRNPLLPTAPTLQEAGLVPVPITPWGGLFGPAKLPKEVVDRVARDIAIVLAKPEVKDALGKLAFEARSSSPQELSAFVAEQLEAYRRAARAVGLNQD
jgi:tripartite-type tricarboxylate transporter receptor subunit TctC